MGWPTPATACAVLFVVAVLAAVGITTLAVAGVVAAVVAAGVVVVA
jgi:hypothetical protein